MDFCHDADMNPALCARCATGRRVLSSTDSAARHEQRPGHSPTEADGHDRSALADFLERAELVYGDREAVVDEPSPPGGGLGRFTYAQFAEMARSLGATLDDLGVGESERVAIVSPNAARFLLSLFGVSVFGRILVPVNFRLNADEIRYILDP